ncbi:putative F-box protein [Capsicum chacoense]
MDRLSELPESILLHILSFLNMRDVVRTAILSKRWSHLWTIVQQVDFDLKDFFPYQNFVDFVNRTLLCRGNCKITRLRIGLFLNASSRKDYVGWIMYATKNNVEELFLDFDSDCCEWLPPPCVYSNSSLKTLRLLSCRLVPAMQIRWNLLTKLTLRFSVLWDDIIRKIMVGAPKLEVFELDTCWGYNDLTFDSPSLRVLIVCDDESGVYEHGPVMRISAPNVQFLRLSGSLYRKCVLMNMPSVVQATLDFHPYTHSDKQKEDLKWKQDNLMELVGCLQHVDSLTLGSWCIEVLALREKRRMRCQISTYECVTLSAYMTEDDLLGTVNLLKGSPALQTLIIDMQSVLYDWRRRAMEYSCNSNVEDYLASQAKHIRCLRHLKTVKLTKFVEQHSVFPFVEFILKNGSVLEDLVIIARRGSEENSPESLLNIAQRLLSMPRASSRAVITLLN